MMMQVMCNVDLYEGDVKAGKWYDVTSYDGIMCEFIDEDGFEMLCIPSGNCAHIEGIEGAFWTFKE